MAFSWMKIMNFASNFTGISSSGANWQYSIIGLDNGSVPSKRQAIIMIIWTSDAYFTDVYMGHLALKAPSELKLWHFKS